MNKLMYPLLLLLISINGGCAQNTKPMEKEIILTNIPWNVLTPEEENVIVNKGTERPYTGKYYENKETGVYTCKRCNVSLYRSSDKFDSHCGWPSFDAEIAGAVTRVKDADGMRTEIVCSNCKGHLGHVFEGEGLTDKNIRHCVNSISMNFIPAADVKDQEKKTDTALFASGCFWGTEYFLQKLKGVISTDVGYTGGTKANPTYHEVSTGNTGHAETVLVVFDPSKTSYEELAKVFFETHDPTQTDGQGPDLGSQYRSAIFYRNEDQHKTANALIQTLKSKGLKVATEVTKAGPFYTAEKYHQDYYTHTGGTPYCHKYTKRF